MLPYIIESSANNDGFKTNEDYKSNPYSVILSKVIDMSHNDTALNRELAEKIGKLIGDFERELTDDTGVWFDKNTKSYRYHRHRKTIARANSISSIMLKKIAWVKDNI